jgi:hypothetical protein
VWRARGSEGPPPVGRRNGGARLHLRGPVLSLLRVFRLTAPARQIHFVCNPSIGSCATKLRALLFEVSLQAGRPPQRPIPPQVENQAEWPPMAACVGCAREETVTKPTRVCAGCRVSRCVVVSLL